MTEAPLLIVSDMLRLFCACGGGELARLGQHMYAAIAARYRTSKWLLCRMTTPTARWLRSPRPRHVRGGGGSLTKPYD